MTAALIPLLVVLAVLAGVVILITRLFSRREAQGKQDGSDVLAYLILALAVAVAGFALARLAREALSGNRLAGDPDLQIAGALAALVVASPIAIILWRRQARRRSQFPGASGWPVYLALIELTFLTAFFVAVAQVVNGLDVIRISGVASDAVIYAGIVAFHWWIANREPPEGELSELPRLVGSGVALIATTVGLVAVLSDVFDLAYAAAFGGEDPSPAWDGIDLLVAGAVVWAWRWLPAWDHEPSPLRRLYLGAAAFAALVTALGSGIALAATLISFPFASRAAVVHFHDLPGILSVGLVALAVWVLHRRAMGPGRDGAVRGYEYAMAAVGLAALVGAASGLVASAWATPIAGDPGGQSLIALGLTALGAGWVWIRFWRRAQANRLAERRTPQRRFFLVGMAVIGGLTAAGALIAVLVVVFRAVLGEDVATTDSLPLSVSLAAFAGLATWHLVAALRADGPQEAHAVGAPFEVTVICSHPGQLAARFPEEARLRVLYRDDGIGVVDDEMADRIVAEVAGRPALVWIDGDGYRVAPARLG